MDSKFFDFDILDLPENDNLTGRLSGENAKGILIVFQNAQNNEELLPFLEKILVAVQLNAPKDTLVLEITAQEKFSFLGLSQKLGFQYFISFGIEPERMGLYYENTLYQPLQYDNCTFLFADDLQKIFEERQQGGKRMSGELWKVLKSLFL